MFQTHILNLLKALLVCCIFTVEAKDPPMVPEHFDVPLEVTLSEFILKKVNPKWAIYDYQAIMSAKHRIRELLNTQWPEDTMTYEENKATLIDDVKAFNEKSRFTYSVFLENGELIGCVYLSPGMSENSQGTIFYWFKAGPKQSEWEQKIKSPLQQWITKNWPLKNVMFPFN